MFNSSHLFNTIGIRLIPTIASPSVNGSKSLTIQGFFAQEGLVCTHFSTDNNI